MFMENASPSSTGIRQEAEQAARRFRLPFSRQAWKGVQDPIARKQYLGDQFRM